MMSKQAKAAITRRARADERDRAWAKQKETKMDKNETPELYRLINAACAYGASRKIHPNGERSVGEGELRELRDAAAAFSGIEPVAPPYVPSATITEFTPPNVAGCAPTFVGHSFTTTIGGPAAQPSGTSPEEPK